MTARRRAKTKSVQPSSSQDVSDAQAFLSAINGLSREVKNLNESVEDLRDAVHRQTKTTKMHDEHNALLCRSIDGLASKIDVLSGLGSFVGRLLPGR